jgi:hypothetical protein
MGVRFTFEDREGSTHIKSWALPLVVAAICVPIVAAFAAGSQGAAIGAGAAFLVASTIVVMAVRTRPFRAMEVASAKGAGHRVLVLAPEELGAEPAQRVAKLAAGAADVRVLVPTPSKRLDRWLSGDDAARASARERLAASAGALTAAGLPVSGSVGDNDPVQAVEDELRSFAADEVLYVIDEADRGKVEKLRHRLALPLTRVPD